MTGSAQWPSLPEVQARNPGQAPKADGMEFELEFFTPDELRAHPEYRQRVGHMLDAPYTTTYCVATAETRKGPFVCILPLDGRIAMTTRGLAKGLVEEAQRELAREWSEQN